MIRRILSLFSLALLAAGCTRTVFVHDGSAIALDAQAKRVDAKPIELRTGEALDLVVQAGSVFVRASESKAPGVRAEITAFGSDEQEAARNLATCQIVVERVQGGAKVRFVGEAAESRSADSVVRMPPRATIEITVPPGVAVRAESASANVQLEGPFAATSVSAKYGAVRVTDVMGDLAVDARSGHIEVDRVRAARSVSLESGYGHVFARNVEAARLEAVSSSGHIELAAILSPEIEARTSYGHVEITGASGVVTARSSSGHVRVDGAGKGSHVLETKYGAVELRRASGAARAVTNSGNVAIREFEGRVEARSLYGRVEVEGVLDAVEAKSNSGRVSVVALPGSVARAPWTLESGYGEVSVALPDGFLCRVDAETRTGIVEHDFAVALEADASGATKGPPKGVLRGVIGEANGDAIPMSLTLRASSGGIRILRRAH